MSVFNLARQAKHRMFVARRSAGRAGARALDPLVTRAVQLKGYTYDPERYVRRGGADGGQLLSTGSTFPVDHLRFPVTLPTREDAPVPRRLFLLWPGENRLTQVRERSLTALRAANDDVEVALVTAGDVARWVVPAHPLHPAYAYLSAVHRSDYLRAYLMYHHGGAYLDLKPYRGRVSAMLDALDADPTLWAVGAPESRIHLRHLSGGPLARDIRLHTPLLPSQAQFAFRPGTPFAAAWLEEVERRLDYFHDLLAAHPARDPFGTTEDYPVSWFALLGSVFAPLTLRHQDRILVRDFFAPLEVEGPYGYR